MAADKGKGCVGALSKHVDQHETAMIHSRPFAAIGGHPRY
jgi:hypothetical protein